MFATGKFSLFNIGFAFMFFACRARYAAALVKKCPHGQRKDKVPVVHMSTSKWAEQEINNTNTDHGFKFAGVLGYLRSTTN